MSTTAASEPLHVQPAAVRRTEPARGAAALAGVVAAAAALATGELIAAFLSGAPSPLAAVGAAVIDFAPAGSKDVIVSLFGTNDKPALLLLITLVVLAVGAGLGLLARRSQPLALIGIVALVGVGFVAMMRQPAAELAPSLMSAGIQAIVGIQALTWLLGAAPRVDSTAGTAATAPANDAARRSFLGKALGLGALAVVGGGIGRAMVEGRATQVAQAETTIPQAVQPASAPGP
ncbi:MAG TPA: hypothetical protein VFL03_08900, partial [Candidatus Limnocylindrales bacterium]|nr:hypothetical protein [Candidatus Limnocylindrales bacterium]